MSDAPAHDTRRATAAAGVILDGRDPQADFAAILVTLEHTIAAMLLVLMRGDPRKAAALLNEGLTPGVEERLAYYFERHAADE